MMEPFTKAEILYMLAAFGAMEDAYNAMDAAGKRINKPSTIEHKRLNEKIMEELRKPAPDHEKIHLLLNAINTVKNERNHLY